MLGDGGRGTAPALPSPLTGALALTPCRSRNGAWAPSAPVASQRSLMCVAARHEHHGYRAAPAASGALSAFLAASGPQGPRRCVRAAAASSKTAAARDLWSE